jgi:hypothetical protein
MMSSKAMPLRLAPPGSLVIVGFVTIPVFLWHLGISAKTWRDIGRTVRRVCRCKTDEAGGKRVTRRGWTAAELIAPGMDAATKVWIAFRSCLPCCKKRGDEPAPTVEAEAPKAEEPKEAWQAPKSRYTITGMKQLFGPSRKKGEIAAGKIGVGMEAEAPKLAENKFRAPTTEDYLAQIQREQEGLIRGPEQVEAEAPDLARSIKSPGVGTAPTSTARVQAEAQETPSLEERGLKVEGMLERTDTWTPFESPSMQKSRGRRTIAALRQGANWKYVNGDLAKRAGRNTLNKIKAIGKTNWRELGGKIATYLHDSFERLQDALDHVEESFDAFLEYLGAWYQWMYDSRLGRLIRYIYAYVTSISIGAWGDMLVAGTMLVSCLTAGIRAITLPPEPKYTAATPGVPPFVRVRTPEEYLGEWRPVITGLIGQGDFMRDLATILGGISAYWTLRCWYAASKHPGVGLYPRTFAASAVIWIEMLPQVLAIIGLFLWANSWRDGWVSYAWEPALWRLLQLSPGVPDTDFRPDLTVVHPATWEDTKVKLASRFYGGLLGPKDGEFVPAWAVKDAGLPHLGPPDTALRDTMRFDHWFRPDLLMELVALIGAGLLAGFIFATIYNTMGRVRFNDSDFVERPRSNFLGTVKNVILTELNYLRIFCRIRRCCGKPSRREALGKLLHSPLAEFLAEVNRRVPGPVEGKRRGRDFGDTKAEALHRPCNSAVELAEACDVFLQDEPGSLSAEDYAEYIELAATALELGEHAIDDGLLGGAMEPLEYNPPPGLVVGGELRPLTWSSQRMGRQLRKVRTDQYTLGVTCEEMAAMYTQLEVTQRQITEEINMHQADTKRLDDKQIFVDRQEAAVIEAGQKQLREKEERKQALKDAAQGKPAAITDSVMPAITNK